MIEGRDESPEHTLTPPPPEPAATPAPKPTEAVVDAKKPAPTPVAPVIPVEVSDPVHDEPLKPTVDIKSDISRILKGIKLPERRGQATEPEQTPMPQAPGKPGDMPQWIPSTKPKPAPATQSQPRTMVMPSSAEQQQRSTAATAVDGTPEPVILEEKEIANPADTGKPADSFFIPSLRTFREDVTTLMRTKKVSVVQEVVMQQKAKEARETGAVEEAAEVKKVVHRKRTGLAFAVFALVLLGSLALGSVVYIAMQRVPGQVAGTSPDSLMFAEQTYAVPIDDTQADTLRKKFGDAREQATLTLGAVTRLVPTELDTEKTPQSVAIGRFLKLIGAKPPDILTRTFLGPFFLGIHTIDQNVPVLVIPIQSYDRALEGMLAWENSINLELSPLYTFVPMDITNASGTPEKNVFKDLVVNNFDTRVLRDEKGEIRLLYAFPTRNLLIITERPNSFIEALARLRAERRL